jgi:hypothetical protein
MLTLIYLFVALAGIYKILCGEDRSDKAFGWVILALSVSVLLFF